MNNLLIVLMYAFYAVFVIANVEASFNSKFKDWGIKWFGSVKLFQLIVMAVTSIPLIVLFLWIHYHNEIF